MQTKNCDPFVSGPALAMLRIPSPVCFNMKFSSANLLPYMDFPPVPFPRVKSPPCTISECGRGKEAVEGVVREREGVKVKLRWHREGVERESEGEKDGRRVKGERRV